MKLKYLLTFVLAALLFIGISANAQTIPSVSPFFVNALNQITQRVSGTPVLVNGNLTVTGTCSGCGGGGGSGTISTSSPLVSGQAVYATGVSTIASIATSTAIIGTGLSYSGTIGNFINGTGGTLTNTGVTSFNTRTGAITLSNSDVTTALGFTPFGGTNPLPIANGGTAASSQITNGINYFDGTEITSSSTLVILPNGNIGIGTSSPSNLLTLRETPTSGGLLVDGSLGQGAGMSMSNNSVIGATISYASSGGLTLGTKFLAPVQTVTFTAGGTTQMTLLGNGNFGIGSTTPGSLLSIGNSTGINFTTATSTFNSTGGINLTSGCFALGGVCLTQNSGTVTSVQASGGTTGFTFSGGPITTSGTVTLAGTLNVANGGTGSTTLSGILIGNGTSALSTLTVGSGLALVGTTLSATGGGSGTVGSGTTGQFPYYAANGTTLTATSSLFLGTNGFVGIGSTTPGFPLSIQAQAGMNYPSNVLFAIGSSTASATTTLLTVGNNDANVLTFGDGTNNLTQLSIAGGRGSFGYVGNYVTTAAGGGKGIIFNVNGNGTINSGTQILAGTFGGLVAIGNTYNESGNLQATAGLDLGGSNATTLTTTFLASTTIAVTNINTTANNFETLAFRTQDLTNLVSTSTSEIVGVNDTHTASTTSGDLTFLTNNAGNLGEVMRITSLGNVGIGTTTPTNTLTLSAGTMAIPALSFGDTATGLYRISASTIGFSAAGAEIAQVDPNGFRVTSLNNIASFSNAKITPSNTGTFISRNIADANTVLTVQQQNAGSTGDILDLQNSAGIQAVVTQAGFLDLGASVGTTSASALTLSSNVSANGITLYNTADQSTNFERGNIMWTGNQFNILTSAGGTGTIRSFKFGVSSAAQVVLNAASLGGQEDFNGFTTSTAGAFGYEFATFNSTAASGIATVMELIPTINQSSTAGYTGLLIDPTETTLGSGTKLLLQIGTSTNPNLFDVTNLGVASSTGLNITGNELVTGNVTWPALGTPAGSFLAVNALGQVISTTTPSTGGGSAYPFTPSTDGGINTSATSTPIQGTNPGLGLDVSNTSWYGIGGLTLAYASTTNRSTVFGLGGSNVATTSSTDTDNSSFGYQTLSKIPTTASFNTAIGSRVLNAAASGSTNTAIGALSMFSATSPGSDYIAIGASAASGNVTGSRNIIISSHGLNGDFNGLSGSGNILLGDYANFSSLSTSGQLDIGNVLYGTGMYNSGSNSAAVISGQIGIGTSTPWAQLSVNPNILANGTPYFVVGSSTATNFIVSSLGNVGIGTTSPEAPLTILAASSTVASTRYTGMVSIISGVVNGVTEVFQEVDQFGAQYFGGDVPTVSSCGSSSFTTGSNDTTGQLLLNGSGGNGCVVTFAHPYAAGSTVHVFVNQDNGSVTSVQAQSISTSGFTYVIAASINGDKLSYFVTASGL